MRDADHLIPDRLVPVKSRKIREHFVPVEKIVIDTKSYTQNDIALVYGGYHLLPYEHKVLTDLSIKLKDELKVKRVAPAHCTGHLAFKILQDYFKDDYVFAGLAETIKF